MKLIRLRYLIAAVYTLATLCCFASNRLYVKDFAINPGETKIIEIYVDNSKPIISLQADIELPAGLTMVCDSIMLTDRAKKHSVMANENDGIYTIMSFSMSNTPFKGNSGPIIEVPVVASDDFSQSGDIIVTDITVQASDRTTLIRNGQSQSKAYIAKTFTE